MDIKMATRSGAGRKRPKKKEGLQDFKQRAGAWAWQTTRPHGSTYIIQPVQKATGDGECISEFECNKDGCTECSNSRHIVSCAKWGIKNSVGIEGPARVEKSTLVRCCMEHDSKHHMQRITYALGKYCVR